MDTDMCCVCRQKHLCFPVVNVSNIFYLISPILHVFVFRYLSRVLFSRLLYKF